MELREIALRYEQSWNGSDCVKVNKMTRTTGITVQCMELKEMRYCSMYYCIHNDRSKSWYSVCMAWWGKGTCNFEQVELVRFSSCISRVCSLLLMNW